MSRKILFLLMLTFFSQAQASLVTVNGNSVSFTYDDSLLDLFGAPIVTGDSLYFTPTSFRATGIGFVDLVSSTFNIKVSALGNNFVSSVGLTERGDYISYGASSQVALGGEVRVVDLSNPLTEVVGQITPTSAFVHQASIFPTKDFEATAGVDFSSIGATSVNITLQNILVALTASFSDIAFIEKKGIILGISSLPIVDGISVPLPAAVWLFGTCLVGFLAYSKRTYNF
ncbi:MAG: hypothetical protein WC782_15520 [Methylococcaceae bacterium]